MLVFGEFLNIIAGASRIPSEEEGHGIRPGQFHQGWFMHLPDAQSRKLKMSLS